MMKIILLSLFVLFLPVDICAYAATSVRSYEVHDGDTITVTLKSGKREKIRLFGIDAPELNQPYGKESRKHLEFLLKNKAITYDADQRDQYGRLTATVYADDESVNLKMVSDGYAWHYKSYSKSQKLAAAQKYAKSNKLGLWKDAKPTPPWQFRRNERGNGKRNDPLIISPVDDFYFCVNLKTFKYIISRDGCPREYIIVIGQ